MVTMGCLLELFMGSVKTEHTGCNNIESIIDQTCESIAQQSKFKAHCHEVVRL